MEHSSRRERSRERHKKRKRDHRRDRSRHNQSSDSEKSNKLRKSKHRKRSKSRSRGRRSRQERSESRHRSHRPAETDDKIDGNKLISETLSIIENEKNRNSSHGTVEEPKTKRKSRWAGTVDDKVYVPGIPSILPSNLNAQQQEAYLLQINIGSISCTLRSGNWEIPENPKDRSPSPEPIYNSNGTRLNTREFRMRAKLEEERHNMVIRLKTLNPGFIPPPDYKPPTARLNDKVMIPQEEYPDTNFVGLLIGPRGNTLKRMEQETGAKIIIRGKGSVKEGKAGSKNGEPLPGENEPLHAYITATTPESLKKALDSIKKTIKQGIEAPDGENNLRKMQLRELAILNGTLRDGCESRCSNCGASDHRSWLCPDKPNITNSILCNTCGSAGHIARDCKQETVLQDDLVNPAEKGKMDAEYLALMAELGETPVKQSGFAIKNKPKAAVKIEAIAEKKSSTEMMTYPASNAITPWNQSGYEQSQMAMPWQMTNMQVPWIGNQVSWSDAHHQLNPPQLSPNNTNQFFYTLPPPPPPPPPM